MGAWGTGIFDDDTTSDVKEDFIDHMIEGKTAHEATQMILDGYLDEFDMEEDLEVMSLVYIGLSAIQMEKNCLQEDVRTHAIKLIERGADLELWEESEEEEFEGRKKILSEFRQKLLSYNV